ncbi:MAG: amidohydrolase [Candidatus Aminicenantes bacterium RBG_16_66_30]|nr:MAG: amidohydrolase [Candidatus Aminicenantes bacterium RBG_16_66_30]
MPARNRRLGFIAVLVALFAILFFVNRRMRSTVDPADLVLMNGKIVTVDDRAPAASWIAVRGDRVAALGSEPKGYTRYVGDGTEIVDLGGALTVPGLIESHGHFTGLGSSKMILDLTKARSWDEIVALVAEAAAAAKPGDWILGRGWHQDKWDRVPEPNVNGLPVHDALSKATPENPVLLTHASGHSSLANAKAMELAKITATTTNPEGGEIIRDAAGKAIGAFLETAQSLVRYQSGHATPEEARARLRKQIELAAQECLAYGVTTFHDAGASFGTVDLYKTMFEDGTLPVRLYVMLSAGNKALAERGAAYRMIGAVDNHLTVRTIKRLIDGALGAHGAWLLEPYADLPASIGLNTESIEELKETAKFAIANGFQVATHAIGDRGNRETLDIYEEAFKANPDKTDLRWRIEHAQHLSLEDIPRFGKLGVIPAMQAIHCTSDAPWVYKRLGEKRAGEGAYVWRKLMAAGAVIPNGTDVPVEPIAPMSCFYAAVTRKLKDGTTFFADQKMTREEALRAYTLNGAYAAFEEGLKGSLTPGKLADITVLSRDILTCPEDDIPGTEVLYTIIGGKVLYRK